MCIPLLASKQYDINRFAETVIFLLHQAAGISPYLLLVIIYSSRPPTAQTASALPIKNVTKQSPSTE